ncbi:MAG: RNA-directed DNA polymerase [Filimonas sp.]|nr:RNA-directed DNA polymerase [Filimonas sp.]
MIKKEASLSQELNTLVAKDRKFSNQEAMLKEMRKARMKLAKEKREQTKQKNKQKKLDKATSWQQTQLENIIYLGPGVSAGLNNTVSDSTILQQFGLPVFPNIPSLANAMQVDLATLRYLLYQRKVSRTNHYHVFEVPKKSGGKRRISAPKKQLKKLQLWVLNNVLCHLPNETVAHGFIRQRSIVTNAAPHVGKDIIVNVDLKDFFPTITYARVKGVFKKLGYSEQQAIIFALICTQAETEEVEMDGVKYYVQNGKRCLPQGSPASPAISNIIAYKLDKKIQGLAAKLNFAYTRYADDLTFSTTNDNAKQITKLLYLIKKIVTAEGFEVHPGKTHIMRKGGQQKVTGIVVNKQLNVERSQLRKFRALLHNLQMNGWKDQQWGNAKHLVNAVEGYINFVNMVNPVKAKLYKTQLEKIVATHGYPLVDNTMPKPTVTTVVAEVKETLIPTVAKEKSADKTDWWSVF